MDDDKLDKIAQLFVVVVSLGLVGFISTIAAVALFGPWIAPLMKYLPW